MVGQLSYVRVDTSSQFQPIRARFYTVPTCCALQEEIAMVASSLAARQDQLAEAITQLTAAVQSLSVGKQEQQEQHEQHMMYPVSGVAMIPWI